MRQLGLLSSYRSLIIVYCAFTMPLCCFMLKGFFDTIPIEIEEAAEMDGCSRLASSIESFFRFRRQACWRQDVLLRHAWNEFMFGYVLINNDARRHVDSGIMVFRGPHLPTGAPDGGIGARRRSGRAVLRQSAALPGRGAIGGGGQRITNHPAASPTPWHENSTALSGDLSQKTSGSGRLCAWRQRQSAPQRPSVPRLC